MTIADDEPFTGALSSSAFYSDLSPAGARAPDASCPDSLHPGTSPSEAGLRGGAWAAAATARPAGDADADAQSLIERLYRTQAPRLRRRLDIRLACPDEAHDLVQDAFARLAGANGLNNLRTPEAFLNRIVRNLLIDRGRRLVHRAIHLPIDEEIELAVPPLQHAELELAQMKQRYREAVAQLPPRMREVFQLHRVDGLAYKEIAARLAISTRTVEWHMAEAIVRIAKLLEDE